MTIKNSKFYIVHCALFVVAFLLVPNLVRAFTASDKFVRTANYYLHAGPEIPPADFEILARYDVVVLPMEAQAANRDFFTAARRLNPDIIFLAYVPTRSINVINANDGVGLRQKLIDHVIDGDWFLRDAQGNKISAWFGTWTVNAHSDWQTYLPQFVADELKSSGVWDGVFYDEVDAGGISWLNRNNIDIDRDGRVDNAGVADATWQQSMTALFRNTRARVGNDWLIFVNGSSITSYQPWINGRMFEDFPTPWEEKGSWVYAMRTYSTLPSVNKPPQLYIVNSSTNNTGDQKKYQDVRYGLTSALLGDGFFSYDFGSNDHGQLWWYDEYDIDLGRPLGKATLTSDPTRVVIDTPGVWVRDFERGRSVVNTTNQPVHVRLGGIFDEIHGVQDPIANAGDRVTSITLAPRDGRVLLKPIGEVRGAVFINGAFMKVYDQLGQEKRSGFFHVEQGVLGGALVWKQSERVIASGNTIEIQSISGEMLNTFYPFGDFYAGGLTFAMCDFNGDGTHEIVAAPGRGNTSIVRTFNLNGTPFKPGFLVYSSGFHGGVHVACGDVNGDGKDEIITGAGSGGGSHVRIFAADGTPTGTSFFAFPKTRRYGAFVAAGDINGDGVAEIIAVEAQGGDGVVRIFDASGRLITWFRPFGTQLKNGVGVMAVDIDDDGKAEIIPMTTELF